MKEFINSEPCAVVLGDNIFYGAGFSKRLDPRYRHAGKPARSTVFGYYVTDPERFGVVAFDETARQLPLKKSPHSPEQLCGYRPVFFWQRCVRKRQNG